MSPVLTPPRRVKRVALTVAATYVAVAGAWIYFSDRLIAVSAGGDPTFTTQLQTLKGWGFVLATGSGCFVLVWRLGVSSWRAAQADLARAVGEATHEAVFEYGPDAGFVLERWSCVAANRAAGALFGCDPGRLIGLGPLDVSADSQPDGRLSRDVVRALVTRRRDGDAVKLVSWRCRRLDGSEFDAEVSFAAMPGAERRTVAWVRDVSEARRTGEALRASEERYRSLAEAAQDSIFIVDRNFSVAYVNGFGARQLGRPVEAVVGRRLDELFAAGTARRQRGNVEQVLRSAEPLHIESPTDLGGREVWLDTWLVPLREGSGEVSAVLGMSRDVSRHHRNERVQSAIYGISEAANSTTTLEALFPAIHGIVGELMPASNFYIALYDPAADLLSFPYEVDEFDEPTPPRKPGRGLTEYVLRTGEPLLASPEVFNELVGRGDVELVGAPSIDWLGVPLRVRDRTIGVLAVQSYTGELRYGEEEKGLLMFVSAQVAMAIERTRAEEALRASEQRLRQIIEHSTNLFYVHTPDHVLRYVSPQCRSFLDCEPEEALVHWTEFSTGHPVNREGLETCQRAIDTGERQPVYELELAGRTGRRIWVEVNEAPVVRDGRTVAIVGALTDITERKRAEAALRESEERFRGIFENAVVGVYRTSPEGWVLMANPALVHMLGYDSFADLAAVNVAEGGYGPDCPRSTFIDRVESEGIVVGLEAVWRRRDGGHVWVRETGRAVRNQAGETLYYEGTVEDITARKQTEAALAESEQRYRALVELSPDAIAVHAGGLIVFVNQRGADMLGYDSADVLVGTPILELVHPDYRELVTRRARVAQEEGAGQPAVEERFLRRDGTAIDVEVSSIPFTYRGRPAVLVVVHDISERLRVEEHLRQNQKLEAIGQLAGGVAHDFNNLLQALLSTVQVLRAGSTETRRVATIVGELETHIRRGASLTRQLLLFSRREVTKPEDLDLNVVVRDTHELLLRLVREDIRITIVTAAQALPVNADLGQLEQVLVNLVVNSIDAMPEGGELTVRTGREGDEWAFFEVHDSGVGIDDAIRGHIFEPFFTTKGAGKGTGLGLSVVHGIVTQHGGRIEVTSGAGQGSAFRVWLPCQGSPEVAPPPATVDLAPLRSGRGERVLLVEDEKGARDGLCEMLTMLGYAVLAVDTGEAAETLPVEQPFDVLLTDLMLPGVHGGELARRLTVRWPRLKIVVMSGYTPDEAIRRGVSDGSVRFLQKPFDMDTVARELRAVLDEEPM